MAQDEAFPSTYAAPTAEPTLLQNATLLTGDGRRLENTSLLLANGVIAWVGEGEVPPETTIVDASERWITPGLIDVHSHLGVYPSPGVAAHSDGNEATAPLLSRTVNLLPTVALMALLSLGALLGLPGVLLALPLVVVLQVFSQRVLVEQVMDRWT